MNRQSKEIERVCEKVENKISYTCDVKNKFDVLSEIKENETSYMLDSSQTSDKVDNCIPTYKKKSVAAENTNTEHKFIFDITCVRNFVFHLFTHSFYFFRLTVHF
jgi:hypothetical protein